MSPWRPMVTAPRDGRWVILQLEGREARAHFHTPFNRWFEDGVDSMPAVDEWPVAWRPEPACAACGAPASQARLGEAGGEYWPERRAELTCDACHESLILAAERFRRARGWTALQEAMSFAWPIPGAHILASDAAGRQELRRRVAEAGACS